MIKMYCKKLKKSIRYSDRIDIFIVIAILILLITPLIIYQSVRTETEDEVITLYISAFSEELLGRETTGKLLREFEEKNPGIRIVLAANDDESDILIFNEGNFSALVAKDALLELNSFTNYDSGTRQMAIPLVSFMDLFFYNTEILSAAGFGSPPKTREDFITYARAVSRGNLGVPATALSLNRNDRQALSRDIFSWIWAGGSDFWSDADNPSLNTRVIVNDLAFFGTLNSEGLLAQGIFETSGAQRLDEFARGRIAMMVASSQVIPYLRGRMNNGAFGVTNIPYSGTGGRYSIGLSALYAGISANSMYLDEAWSFLVFLAERSSLFCTELKAIPGMISNITPGDYVTDDPFYSKAWDIFESSRIVDGFSGKPGAEEYKTVFLEELQVFFETNRSAQETVNVIQRRWNEVVR